MKQKPRPGLSLATHRALGSRIQDLRVELIYLMHLLRKSYVKASAVVRLSRRLYDTMNTFQSELEDECYRDHPTDANTHIYYGKSYATQPKFSWDDDFNAEASSQQPEV